LVFYSGKPEFNIPRFSHFEKGRLRGILQATGMDGAVCSKSPSLPLFQRGK